VPRHLLLIALERVMADDTMLYLGEGDVAALDLEPGECREAVASAFRAKAEGDAIVIPAVHIDFEPGHGFRSLCAAWPGAGVACGKWLGVRPVGPQSRTPGVNALITLSDADSGLPLAVISANRLTGLRTAAMSALAALALADRAAGTIGFVGCGLQAQFHLEALLAVFPSVTRVLALSRTERSAQAFAEMARSKGLEAQTCNDPQAIVRSSKLLVTSVPLGPDAEPVLDPRWLQPGSFVSAIDLARSWTPQHLRSIEVVTTDDHDQQATLPPLSAELGPKGTFDADLGELASGRFRPRTVSERAMFVFRGSALADLAVALLAWRRACERGIGVRLPR
jgi:ornithine cyclodeaminase/alanine dehydrogenase-like protein (mu-crystallin family)